ncbi:hypothetical protein HanRHA438_Chr16g0775791 [Helianthus annuus]|nr:hypothetical protein HanRHA438_Chr16g0775791 [Helianthus annuus]
MAGLSRNWPHMNAEPSLKDGDEEVGLLKYIKGKGLGAVRFSQRLLAENEDNILDRTKGICYDGPGDDQGLSRVQSKTKGDVNTGGGDVEIPPERMPDLPFGSGTKLEPLVAPGTNDTSKTRMLVAVVSSKNGQLPEKYDAEQPNVSLETPALEKRSAKRGRTTKIVFSESGESSDEADQKHVPESDVQVLDRAGSLAQLVGSVPELVTRYERKAKREARLRDRIPRYCLRMTLQDAKNAKLAKKVRKLKKRAVEHAKVVQALKKEMEDARVEGEEKLKRVSSERKWLIEEGFEYIINRLHRSREYLEPLNKQLYL